MILLESQQDRNIAASLDRTSGVFRKMGGKVECDSALLAESFRAGSNLTIILEKAEYMRVIISRAGCGRSG
jgi:hypothetical protein